MLRFQRWLRRGKSFGGLVFVSWSLEDIRIRNCIVMNGSAFSDPLERKATRLGAVILVVGFILALLPWAGSYITYYPDERHYSDGGLEMLRGGQWLWPVTPEGSYRFNKPILAYWAAAGGMALLGAIPLGARLVFLLASAGAVYVTYRIGLLIFENRRSALLAGAMMATNGVLVPTAMRSIPDALLVFFMSLSLLGFVAIQVVQRNERRWYWMAYVGAGLVLASKGGMGLLVVGYFLIVALATRGLPGLRRLLHGPSMLTGLVVGGAWYVAAVSVHGSDMWQQFWGDQVGQQIVLDFSSRLKDVFRYSSFYVLQFLPWLLFLPELLVRNWRIFRSRSAQHHRADLATLGWLVVIGIIFSFSRTLSDRYTLAVAPLAAVMLAGLFHLADPGKRRSQMGLGLKVVLTLLILSAAVVAWINISLDQTVLAVGVLAFGLGLSAVLWFVSRKERLIPRCVAIGLGMLAIIPIFSLVVGQVALPDQGEQIATTLRQHQLFRGQSNHQPIIMIGKGGLAAKIRVFTYGEVDLQSYLTPDSPGAREAARSANWILSSRENFDSLGLSEWQSLEASRVFADKSAGEVFRAVGQGKLGELLRSRRAGMILAHRE